MNQNLVIGIALSFIVIAVITRMLRKRKRHQQTDQTLLEGRFTTGRIVSVKRQTGFDRERGHSDIRIVLEYRDPTTGEVRTIRHQINRTTPNIPSCIDGAGSGRLDLGALRRKHAEMKAYASSLEAQGSSEEEVKQAMMDRALEQAQGSTGGLGGEEDADGYLPLKELVEVDVYLHVQAPMRNGVHIVFKR